MNDSQANCTLVGTDLTGLWLQPGFVEGIIADHQSFATLEAAYQHIFRRNLEYAILLWNGIPIRLSYPEDIAVIAPNLISMLQAVQQSNTLAGQIFQFQTPNLQYQWQVAADSENITIEALWQQIPGCYEAALNRLKLMRMPRLPFLYEWKLLLRQLIQALADASATLTQPEARNQLDTLQKIEAAIPFRGRFYQY